MTALAVIQEVGHWSALAPLLVCLVLAMLRRSPSPEAIMLAGAFFISFAADGVMAWTAARGLSNLWLIYVYAPIQFGLFAWIIARDPVVRHVAVGGIALLGIESLLLIRFGSFETVTQITGGALVGLLVLEQPMLRPYRMAVLVYCLAAIPFLLVMGALPPAASGAWVYAWVGYQAVRVTALALLSWALIRQPLLRLELVDGSGTLKASARRRAAGRGGSGADRNAEAQARRRLG